MRVPERHRLIHSIAIEACECVLLSDHRTPSDLEFLGQSNRCDLLNHFDKLSVGFRRRLQRLDDAAHVADAVGDVFASGGAVGG